MGSPYRTCKIRFYGDWIPDLPADDWQDIKASSPDGRHLALVRWNAAGNTPGFHIVRIDTLRKKHHTTRRMTGFCGKIRWARGKFICDRG